MTLDKIKKYMQPEVYIYWTETFFNLTQDNYDIQKEILSNSIKKNRIRNKYRFIK